MFDYGDEATRDGDGWLITCPDFTGVNTDAENEDEISQRARDALLTMLEHYVRTRTELPAPTFEGSTSVVVLGEIVDLKLMRSGDGVERRHPGGACQATGDIVHAGESTAGPRPRLEGRADPSRHGCDRRAADDRSI